MSSMKELSRVMTCVDTLKLYSSPTGPGGVERYYAEVQFLNGPFKDYDSASIEHLIHSIQIDLDNGKG